MKLRTAKVLGYDVVTPATSGLLDNNSPRNFAKLGAQFLQATRFTNEGFQNGLQWPTYFLAFQSLELYLKCYLLSRGRKLVYVRNDISHDVKRALDEAKKEGLVLNGPEELEDLVADVGDSYLKRDFQYRSIGRFTLMAPDVLIGFVEQVRAASGN